jgi:hypothetical protein
MSRPLTLTMLAAGLALIACSVSLPSVSRVTGSGNVVSLEQDFSDFDRLVVSHAFRTTVTQGDSFDVVIRIDDNLQPYLRVEQDGDTLSIGLTDELGLGLLTATLEADITLPSLASLDASGGTHVTLAGFEEDAAVSLNASGASRLEGHLETPGLDLTVSGASGAELSGSAEQLHIDANGASRADMGAFAAVDADVVVNGASNATVNVSGTLNADASGASHVTYLGAPTLGAVNVSGGSSVDSG